MYISNGSNRNVEELTASIAIGASERFPLDVSTLLINSYRLYILYAAGREPYKLRFISRVPSDKRKAIETRVLNTTDVPTNVVSKNKNGRLLNGYCVMMHIQYICTRKLSAPLFCGSQDSFQCINYIF